MTHNARLTIGHSDDVVNVQLVARMQCLLFASCGVSLASTTSKDHATSAKLLALLQFAARLGMRTPSEPTIKWLTSVFLVLTETPSSLQLMSVETKKVLFTHVKNEFHSIRGRLPDPTVEIDMLPANPFELQRRHPMLWAHAFGQLTPGRCRLNMQAVAEVDNSFACRSGRAVLNQTSARSCNGEGNITRMASSVFDAASASQLKMFELMMQASNGGVGGSGRRPNALMNILCDRPQQVGTLQRAQSLLALPPPENFDSLHDDSQSQRQDALSPVVAGMRASPTPKPAASVSTLAIAPQSPQHSASAALSDVAAMLDAFSDRRRAKTALAKAATVAKVATPPAAPSAETLVPAARTERAKEIANAPMLDASSDRRRPKVTSAKAAAVAKVALTPSTPSAEKVVPVARVKANREKEQLANVGKRQLGDASVSNEVTPASLEPLVLGCAKCRFRDAGCGQCRNPQFNGKRGKPLHKCANS